MKGRIQCPSCSKIFNIKKLTNSDDVILTCPHCNNTFNIHQSDKSSHKSCKTSNREDCSWEEHGEPRKTILSSIKPRTDKPMIATILLLIVVFMGISAAITPMLYLQPPNMVLSSVGIQGSASFEFQNKLDMEVIKGNLIIQKNNENYQGFFENNSIIFQNIPLGRHDATLIVNFSNQSIMKEFELFIIPFLMNTYDITLSNQDKPLAILISYGGLGWCSIILLLFSVVCLIGALSSWRRIYSDVAFIGSLVGIFTLGYFFIGSLLSLIALILIYKARDEFDDGKKGKSF
jgi:hypothetical protein